MEKEFMLQKGDTVVMHTCGEAEHYEGQIWVCSSDEFTSSSGTQVVFLEGFSGYFMVEYLQKINFDFSYQKYLADEKNYEKIIHEHAELLHFHDTACELLSSDQIEEIEEEMRNIPEMSI